MMDERMKRPGTNEGAKRQREWMEGIAQRTKKRPTSRDAYIRNECRARNGTRFLYRHLVMAEILCGRVGW